MKPEKWTRIDKIMEFPEGPACNGTCADQQMMEIKNSHFINNGNRLVVLFQCPKCLLMDIREWMDMEARR